MATILLLQKTNANEKKLTRRQFAYVDNTLRKSFNWQVGSHQCICKRQALRISIGLDGDATHNVHKRTILINLTVSVNSSILMASSTLFATDMLQVFTNTLLSLSINHNQIEDITGIKGQTSHCSIFVYR